MCFSASADITGGIAVGVIGLDVLRHTTSRRHLPLAALPVLFAGHLITEAFVWWGLDGGLASAFLTPAIWMYSLFAFAFLPAYVPLAVLISETSEARKRKLKPFFYLGSLVAAILFLSMLFNGIVASAEHHYIRYFIGNMGDSRGISISAIYVIATCTPFFLSSSRALRAYGVVNLVATVILSYLTVRGFISLWCAWAALSSGAVAFYLRKNTAGMNPTDSSKVMQYR